MCKYGYTLLINCHISQQSAFKSIPLFKVHTPDSKCFFIKLSINLALDRRELISHFEALTLHSLLHQKIPDAVLSVKPSRQHK